MLTSRVSFILSRHISLMLCKSVNIVSSKRAQGIMYGKVFFFFMGYVFQQEKLTGCIEHGHRNTGLVLPVKVS